MGLSTEFMDLNGCVKKSLFFRAIKPEMGDHNILWTGHSFIIDEGPSNAAIISHPEVNVF